MTTQNSTDTPKLVSNGQLMIGSGTAQPVAATLTQSTGMSITNGAGSITLAVAATVPTVIHTGSGDATPSGNAFTISGAGGVTTTGSGSTVTITGPTSSLTYSEQTGTSQTLAINTGVVANNASQVTLTLPATAAQFSVFEVIGKGAGGWKLGQAASQTIHYASVNTTTGTGGSLASNTQYDCVRVICTTANTDFVVQHSVGNLTYV